MIIDFRNMNGGGGGSGYTLPIASSEVLGGIKVGDFLSINSAGTLSVETTKRIGYVEYDGQVKVDDFITTLYSTFAFIKENDTNSDIELFTIVSYGNRTKAYLKSDNKYYVKQYDDTEIEITGNTPVNIYNATYTFDLSGNNLTVTADINGKDVVDLYSGTVSMFPIATTGSTGVVKVGSGLTITSDGTLNSQQNYEIVSAITDYTAGKMYAVVGNGETTEFVGNPSEKIKCGDAKTHFYGEVDDTSAKYVFNPWLSSPINGNNQVVDLYVTKEVGASYPTLTVNYGNTTFLDETLTHNLEDVGNDTYALPAHTFSGGIVFSGVNVSIIFNGDNSIAVDFDCESDTSVNVMNVPTNVFNWNTNVSNCSGSTTYSSSLKSIEYTDGSSAHSLFRTATTGQTGLVKIGSGITVDSAGTISVESQGGGIPVVNELPASGSNGDMVYLSKYVDGCYVTDANGNILDIMDSSTEWYNNHLIINGLGHFSEDIRIMRIRFYAATISIFTDSEHFYYGIYNEDQQTWVEENVTLEDGTIAIDTSDYGFDPSIIVTLVTSGNTIDLTLNQGSQFDVDFKLPPKTYNNVYVFDTVSPRCTVQTFKSENLPRRSVITYFGELPANQILFGVYHSFWGESKYVSYDGISTFKVWQNSGMTELWYTFNIDSSIQIDNLYRISATDGIIVMDSFVDSVIPSVYGNWANTGNGNWKPVEYDEILHNAYQYTTKFTSVKLYAPQIFDGNVLWIGGQDGQFTFHIPQTGGEEGQILYGSGSNELAPKWGPLPIHIVDQLPSYGSDGSLYIVPNDNINTPASGAFISKNSTNIDDKNNFTFTDETGHMGDGQFIYVNKGNYTSTGDTLVAVIQMRTNENGDWNTSDLKEINVYLKYDSGNNAYYYEAEWNFSYNNVTYNSAITISDGQSVDTDFFPIWRYWDGGYGYKFNFVNSGDNLTFALRNSDYDRDSGYSGYVEGEQYGYVAYRNPYYVKEFFNIGTSNTLSTLYTFKGGQWINLGETQVPVV